MSELFQHKDLTIEYTTYGSGSDIVFAFHGFGRTAKDFQLFESILKDNQRIVAINLFAHGNSVFPENRITHQPLTQNEWRDCMLALMVHFHITQFDLLGYSMGGRICLVTLQIMPEKIRTITLLATDGLKINMLYRFASGTKLGRKIYASVINNPAPLFRLAKWLNKLGLLNDKLHRFVHVHLDTKEKRQLVHDAWLIYKEIFPNLEKVGAIIRTHPYSFNMVFGKYDSVIRPHLGEKFSQIIGTTKHMHILEAGHRLLNDQSVQLVKEKNMLL